MDTINLQHINESLSGTIFHSPNAERLHHFPTIGSTNTYAIEEARNGAPAGSVYIADEQTAGRGRSDHRWYSAAGDGLYVSVLLRPALAASEALKLSLATGLAVQSAIAKSASLAIDLRWPNDLVVPATHSHAKKCGGILTETSIDTTGRLHYAVIGIGLNLNQAEFPSDLRDAATSLRIATGTEISRNSLLIQLLLQLSNEIDLLEQELRGKAGLLPLNIRFARASSWVHGKHVSVSEDGGYTGVTAGLNEQGLLKVLLRDGSERTVRHGGVREIIP